MLIHGLGLLALALTPVALLTSLLEHQSLSGRTSSYLAANIQLIRNYGRQNLRCTCDYDRTYVVPCIHNIFGDKNSLLPDPVYVTVCQQTYDLR